MWVSSSTSVYTAGTNGTIFEFDGSGWSLLGTGAASPPPGNVPPPTVLLWPWQPLYALHGTPGGRLCTVGAEWTVLRKR